MTSAHNGARVLVVGVIVPAVITIGSVLAMLLLAASGPSRIATHWGFSGEANGYGSPFSYPILMGAVALPLIALLGGGSVLLAHRSPLSPVIKLTAVAGVWTSTFLAFLLIGGLLSQRSAAGVASAKSPGLEILLGVVVALLLGVGAWFVLPRAARRPAAGEPPATPPISLGADERATWLRSASATRGVLAVFVALVVVLGGVELAVVWTSGGRAWWVSFVPVVLLLVLLSSFAWTVRVDSRGARIRSAIGVPTIWIPIDNVVSATVVEVSPLGEFGGYGIRWSFNGRLGVILRSGEALEIRRRKGLDVIVTVDDAATAAALLNGLVARASGATSRS